MTLNLRFRYVDVYVAYRYSLTVSQCIFFEDFWFVLCRPSDTVPLYR
jgi:hypothetical protein